MDHASAYPVPANFTRLSQWRDNLINFVSSLGTNKDPTTASRFSFVEIDRFSLENAYRSDWIARRLIDAPAEDATRKWRNWNATNQQVEALKAEEKRLELRKKVRQWIIRARLYGGAALVVGVDDGHESWEPLDLDNVKKDSLKFVAVMNRYELNAGPRIYNVSSRWYTRPEYYTVASPIFGFYGEEGGTLPGSMYAPLALSNQRGPYIENPVGKQPSWTSAAYERPQGQSPPAAEGGQVSGVRLARGPAGGFGGDPYKQVSPYFGMVRLHPSRVMELWGNELPDWRLAPMGGGWGDSALQTVDEALRDWGITVGSIANMANDAKTDVISIKDLTQRITTQEYRQRLLDRFSLANVSKSTINALLLDSEEEWRRIQTSFSGMAEVLREYMVVISGASNIPISRLFGQSAGRGLGAGSSGGEQDLHNYYDWVAAWQQDVVTPVMEWLDQALIRSTLGSAKKGVSYEWAPLWQMSDAEKATVALNKAQAFQIDVQLGLINENVLRRARINQLVEDGTYPGLQDAVEEFGEAPDAPDESEWSPMSAHQNKGGGDVARAKPIETQGMPVQAPEIPNLHADGGKVSKESVDYRPGTPARHCGICRMFQQPRSCSLVAGDIDPPDVCDEFILIPQGKFSGDWAKQVADAIDKASSRSVDVAVVVADALKAMPQPVINVTVPITMPKKGVERTVVTKHDSDGRIAEFEKHEVEEGAP